MKNKILLFLVSLTFLSFPATTISECQTLTESGKYVLESNIGNVNEDFSGACLYIDPPKDGEITIDGKGNSIKWMGGSSRPRPNAFVIGNRNPSSVTIKNLRIEKGEAGSWDRAIQAPYCNLKLTVQNLSIKDTQGIGINAHTLKLFDSEIENAGGGIFAGGVWVGGGCTKKQNFTIEIKNNKIVGSGSGGGLTVEAHPDGGEIKDNVIKDNQDCGIILEKGAIEGDETRFSDIVVTQNEIRGNTLGDFCGKDVKGFKVKENKKLFCCPTVFVLLGLLPFIYRYNS